MKVLIVDNKTARMHELYALLSGNDIEYKDYTTATLEDANNSDLVVLTGGSGFPIVGNEDKLQNEINIIKHTTTPILGICFGFELLHVAFDGVLHYHEVPVHGVREICFESGDCVDVFEFHRWLVKKVRPEFVQIAHSDIGVEVMRHKKRKIVGTQFHPEMLPDKTYGDEFFRNMVEELTHEIIQ